MDQEYVTDVFESDIFAPSSAGARAPQRPPEHEEQTAPARDDELMAAIDIGTVTTRFLVARVHWPRRGGAPFLLEEICECRITNLGRGVDATGRLKASAMLRVRDAIEEFAAILKARFDCTFADIPLAAVTTSASRDAENSREFMDLIRDCGVELSVITGEREAELTFAGASGEYAGEPIMVVDIGGGSTEIIVGLGGRPPARLASFDVGCRRLTERYFAAADAQGGEESVEVLTDDVIRAAEEDARATLEPFFEGLAKVGFSPDRIVAVAGTATSVVSIRDEMEVYDASAVHGACVTREELESVFDKLRSIDLDERRHVVGLQPERADVIVAGLIILRAVLDLANIDCFNASESDILQGMILDKAAE